MPLMKFAAALILTLCLASGAQTARQTDGPSLIVTGLPNAVPVASSAATSTTFLQAINNARSQVVRVTVIGDSFSRCDQASCQTGPPQFRRWPDLLRQQLQAMYGSHGTGVVPIAYATGAINGVDADPNAWTITGTYDRTNVNFGPFSGSAGTLIHLASGATATFADLRGIPWDTLHVYCASSSSTGSLALAIDGVTVSTNICPSTSAAQANNIAAPSVALGTHVAKLTSTGDTYVYGVDGEAGTTGVSVDNLAVGGATAGYFGAAATNFAFSDLIDGGSQLTVLMDQTNDVAGQVTTATFQANLTSIITHQRALASAPTVLLAIPPVDIVNGSYPMAAYTAVQTGLCTSLSLTCVNIQARASTVGSTAVGWGTSYNAASGLWDTSGTQWPSGSGGVHPGVKGSADEFQQIYAAAINPVAAVSATAALPSGYAYNQLFTVSGTIADSTVVAMGNTAGSTVTLPVPAQSVNMVNTAGIFAGPAKHLYFINTTLGGSAGAVTLAAPSGWNLIYKGTVGQSASIPTQVGVQCYTFSFNDGNGGTAYNWYCQ